jgi:hypothetical protein
MWTHLRLTVLHAEFRAELDGDLPDFKGSTLRGALGHALKEVSCLEPAAGRPCATCPRPDRCAAGALFDEPSGPRRAEDHDRPSPYILTPPADPRATFRAGDRLALTLTLVGRARVWHPWVIAALAGLGWRGLGVARRPWSLAALGVESPVAVVSPVGVATLGVGDPLPELTGGDLVASQPFPPSGATPSASSPRRTSSATSGWSPSSTAPPC